MNADKKLACRICGKEFPFKTRLKQHIKAHFQKQHEPSMAERLIDAQIDRAMGDPVDDDLLEMLPEEE